MKAKTIILTGLLLCSLLTVVLGQTEYSICEIQGPDLFSPYDGQMVKTRGIVTADLSADDKLKGFFMQSDCDLTIPSSRGIFVYTGNDPQTFSVGDEVEVVAEVKEFFDLTELTNLTEFNVLSNGNQIEPTVISLPVSRRSDLELYEGMYVRFEQTLYVNDHFNLGRFGELGLSSGGALSIPTQTVDPNDSNPEGTNYDGASNVQAILDQQELNQNNYIILDDGSTQQNPSPTPYLDETAQTLTIGSRLNELEGVLTYSFSEYRLHPTQEPVFELERRDTRMQFTADVPPLISVCGFNVLNYFTTLNVWGATSPGELDRQTSKLTHALTKIEADVFGLMEIENNGEVAYSALLAELNANLDFTNYAAIDAEDPGTFNTKSVIFYNTSTIEPVGPVYATDPNQFERPSLAQIFKPVGEDNGEFLFVINHLRFKGCDGADGPNQDQNDGQACFNQRRKDQVLALVSFIEDIQEQTGVVPVYVMGDMNAYYEEDPIDIFRSNGYQSYFENDQTSFLFRGESGALDHAMLNDEAVESTFFGQVLHINSTEPRFLEYSDDNVDQFQDNEYRCSDHDPVIIWINQDKLSDSDELASAQNELPHVYPNPSSGNLTISAPSNAVIEELKLLDLTGKLIRELNPMERSFELSELELGTYILEVQSANYIIALPWVKQ